MGNQSSHNAVSGQDPELAEDYSGEAGGPSNVDHPRAAKLYVFSEDKWMMLAAMVRPLSLVEW